MNRRIIKTVLASKFNKWVKSIQDNALAVDVRENSIVTGGCITSLLLGEPINDIDIYFTNIQTTKAVVDYYVGAWNKAHEGNGVYTPQVILEKDKHGVPARVRIRVQSDGVAGDPVVDVEVDNEVYAEKSEKDTESEKGTEKEPYHPVYLTDNAITLSDDIQLVIRFFGDAAEIHKNFDFIHCTSYWESETGKLELPAAALESILAKELRYVGSLYPVASFIRTRKFLKRGWHINAGQMLKICLQISAIDLMDVSVLEEQLTGVDTMYFRWMIEELKTEQAGNPDFHVDMSYVVALIDKIF